MHLLSGVCSLYTAFCGVSKKKHSIRGRYTLRSAKPDGARVDRARARTTEKYWELHPEGRDAPGIAGRMPTQGVNDA